MYKNEVSMPNGKIEVKLGSFSFMGEGDENWLAKQMDKILEKLNQLQKVSSMPSTEPNQSNQIDDQLDGLKEITLASFLKEKNATKNQNRKFLATAIWLQKKGKSKLTTNDITKALSTSSQKKLTNPSESLNQNIKKGFCEKEGSQFYVTDEGIDSL